jgi:hypothetical protein
MAEWLRAQVKFASFYSYRVPDLSPSFSLSSPVPSPAAIRLALVDAVIRHTGKVDEGKAIFDLVRDTRLEIEPPEHVAVMKFFLKRLKPEKPPKGKRASVIPSTGVREYCLPSGPMVFWLETDQRERITEAFCWLRRLGTTDSLASCNVGEGTPDTALCAKRADALPLTTRNFMQRPVFPLNELKIDTAFEQVNPYSEGRRGQPFDRQLYVLPLVREQAGENWVIYRRESFEE